MADDFKITNDRDWKKIHQGLFGVTVPTHSEWTSINDIITVLNVIGRVDNSNHLFFPDGGGLDLEGAKLSNERGCIELNLGVPYIIKPKKLTFESIDSNFNWNYFRLEADVLQPTGLYESRPDSIDEEVCELEPQQYIKRHHYEQGEYQGEQLPDTARVVIRYFKGSFVIFKKTSIYNSISSTYDGRHAKMSEKEFRAYIEKGYKDLSTVGSLS